MCRNFAQQAGDFVGQAKVRMWAIICWTQPWALWVDEGGVGQEKLGRRVCISVHPHIMQGSSYQILNPLGSFFPAYLELGMVCFHFLGSIPAPAVSHQELGTLGADVFVWPEHGLGLYLQRNAKLLLCFFHIMTRGLTRNFVQHPRPAGPVGILGITLPSKAKWRQTVSVQSSLQTGRTCVLLHTRD